MSKTIIISESQLDNIKKHLIEAKASVIHPKYYSDISEDDFNKIVSADPFSKLDKDYVSGYGVWLLSLYKSGNLTMGDLNKATEYIPIFHRYSGKFVGLSPQNYPNLGAMRKMIAPYMEEEESEDVGGGVVSSGWERVYDDENYYGLKVKTKEASIVLGKGTKWCTARPKDGNKFDDYISEGPLYVIINKNNETDKYQFHYQRNEFGDKEDLPIKFSVDSPLLKPLGVLQPGRAMRLKIGDGEIILDKEGNSIVGLVGEITRYTKDLLVLVNEDNEYALFNMSTKKYEIPYGEYAYMDVPSTNEVCLTCHDDYGDDALIDVYINGMNKIASQLRGSVYEIYNGGEYLLLSSSYGTYLYNTQTKTKSEDFDFIDDFDPRNNYFIATKQNSAALIKFPNEIIIPFGKYSNIDFVISHPKPYYRLQIGKNVVGRWDAWNGYRDANGNKMEENKKSGKTVIISESQLNRIKLTEMMDTRMKFPKMGITVDDVLGNIVQCGGYDGLYPGSEDDTKNTDGSYPFDNKEQMLTRVYKICFEFDQFEDPFPVWRSIRVDKLYNIKRGKFLGHSWSFDRESAKRFAESIWGNTGNTLLKAECPFNAVDWVETISRYIQDNTEESKFNSSFSENEIYVKDPDKLLNDEVDETTLKEGKNHIQKLLDEARIHSLSAIKSNRNNTHYVFTECPTPSKKEYVKCNISRVDIGGTKSKYFLMSEDEQNKHIVRKSNHWSQCIIRDQRLPKEVFEKDNILQYQPVNIVFGTQQPIKDNIHYSIELKSLSVSDIPIELLKYHLYGKDQYGNNYLYQSKTGSQRWFLSLDSNTLGLKDNAEFCGEIVVPAGDDNIMS